MLGVANESLEPVGLSLRKSRNGGWVRVPELPVVVEPLPVESDDSFVLDVTYQDRPDLHPHMPVFAGRMACEEFFD